MSTPYPPPAQLRMCIQPGAVQPQIQTIPKVHQTNPNLHYPTFTSNQPPQPTTNLHNPPNQTSNNPTFPNIYPNPPPNFPFQNHYSQVPTWYPPSGLSQPGTGSSTFDGPMMAPQWAHLIYNGYHGTAPSDSSIPHQWAQPNNQALYLHNTMNAYHPPAVNHLQQSLINVPFNPLDAATNSNEMKSTSIPATTPVNFEANGTQTQIKPAAEVVGTDSEHQEEVELFVDSERDEDWPPIGKFKSHYSSFILLLQLCSC
ncbi:hypothetical protein DFH28DRAFT_923859 [Melampsora americana]|nr:hypothetical protein DFH28DRAFT_923859 [Melampsora americana]